MGEVPEKKFRKRYQTERELVPKKILKNLWKLGGLVIREKKGSKPHRKERKGPTKKMSNPIFSKRGRKRGFLQGVRTGGESI